jgi:hypothetical protein
MTNFSARQKALIEGYFSLRQDSSLKNETGPFEGQPWRAEGKSMVRKGVGGSKLIVYKIENDLEVCVVYPDGTMKSFSQPMVVS